MASEQFAKEDPFEKLSYIDEAFGNLYMNAQPKRIIHVRMNPGKDQLIRSDRSSHIPELSSLHSLSELTA